MGSIIPLLTDVEKEHISERQSLPEKYLALSDQEMDARIAAARRSLGTRLVILGHHYQRDEVIKFADYTGDSFRLARQGAMRSTSSGRGTVTGSGAKTRWGPGQGKSAGSSGKVAHGTAVQVPGGDQTPATVATGSGQYDARRRGVPDDRQIGKASSGVLHHLGKTDTEDGDHDAVDLPHLVDGEIGQRCGREGIGHRGGVPVGAGG